MTTTATETTVTTEAVTPLDLAVGDIVRESGLRLRVDSIRTWHGHGTEVASCKTTILNPEFLTTSTGRYLFGGIMPLDGSEGWTVQGNRFARAYREIPTA